MKRSTDRVLTTHAGSLPQPHDLAEMLAVKDTGQPYDQEAFAQRLRSAIAEVVRKQVASGIDIICDGEQSKRSFTTYVRERLGGLEERMGREQAPSVNARDVRDFPDYYKPTGGVIPR